MSRHRGKSLELFYVDGKPDGMVTAEIFNWTGHVLMTPRTQLPEALYRPVAGHTGAYVLTGENEGGLRVYIGESENVAQRLKHHAAEKDWWTHAYVLTSAANALNKAHVKYLESRLIAIAKEVGAARLENGNAPALVTLNEAGAVTMEEFLDNLMMALPALGLDVFLRKTRPIADAPDLLKEVGTRFELVSLKHDLHALAYIDDGDFVVEAKSSARCSWGGRTYADSSSARLHNELLVSGVIKTENNKAYFSQNYAFGSPSAAADVVTGRSNNGTLAWRVVGTGQTYKAWEANRLSVEDNE